MHFFERWCLHTTLWNIQSKLITPLMRSTSDAPFLCSDAERLNVKANANVCPMQEIHKLWPWQLKWQVSRQKKQQIYVCAEFSSFMIGFGVEMKSSIEHCTNLKYWTNDCSVPKKLLFSRLLLVTCLGLGRRASLSISRV